MVGLPNPPLDEAQVAAAAALMQALSLGGGSGQDQAQDQAAAGVGVFDPSQVQNPWLQRHYTVVEVSVRVCVGVYVLVGVGV